jgi:trimethylguanosine synthase
LDAFCGCGGNAIGFAKVQSPDVKLIVCVDNDRSKLRRAANNASIYGIHSDKIVFIECDSTFILQHCYKDGELIEYDNAKTQWGDVETETIKGFQIGGISLLPKRLDAIFLSPPWGGPNYMAVGKKGYLLESISVDSTDGKIRGDELLVMAKNACKEKIVLYFVPKSINGHAVGKSAWKANYKNVEIEKNILNGKLKTVTIYLKN